MRIHLAKALQAIWYTAMGGFLGLTGGLVVAIIVIFKGAEKIAASPGVAPYNDPAFAAFSHQAVAGYTGQMLFKAGGVAALVLLGLAVLSLMIHGTLRCGQRCTGTHAADRIRFVALIGTMFLMTYAAMVMFKINATWPGLYDTAATAVELADRRAAFDRLHARSSRVVTAAWLCGLVAIGVSPWCRQPAVTQAADPGDPGR